MNKPMFTPAAATRAIMKELARMKPGEVVTYKDLEAATGEKIQGNPAFYSARNKVERQNNVVFEAIRQVGLKCLEDSEIIKASGRDVRKITRQARRSARRITSIQDYNSLSLQDQLQHTINMSVFSMTMEIGSRKGQALIEDVAKKNVKSGEVPIKQIAQAFFTS